MSFSFDVPETQLSRCDVSASGGQEKAAVGRRFSVTGSRGMYAVLIYV